MGFANRKLSVWPEVTLSLPALYTCCVFLRAHSDGCEAVYSSPLVLIYFDQILYLYILAIYIATKLVCRLILLNLLSYK
jgi:hypothetical protein